LGSLLERDICEDWKWYELMEWQIALLSLAVFGERNCKGI